MAEDMKIGDITMWLPLYGGGSKTMIQPVYEISRGNYYALIEGEKYKVRENPYYKSGSRMISSRYRYMITYKGSDWYFDL